MDIPKPTRQGRAPKHTEESVKRMLDGIGPERLAALQTAHERLGKRTGRTRVGVKTT